MKRPFLLLFITFLFTGFARSQSTLYPSCYSNAHGWTITKIENSDTKTYVYLSLYYHKDYRFYVNPGMYIENYNNGYSQRYYIRRFLSHELSTTYTAYGNTSYDFVFEFDRIPYNWTDINIIEPDDADGNPGWYWKYITLGNPASSRLKIDRFFLNTGIKFLADVAHPLTTYRFSVYTVDYDAIRVTLYYQGGIATYLKIPVEGSYFGKVMVLDDNDCLFCYPFTGLQLLKDWAFKQDNYDSKSSAIERFLGKVISDMDGTEVASLVLNLEWLGYN